MVTLAMTHAQTTDGDVGTTLGSPDFECYDFSCNNAMTTCDVTDLTPDDGATCSPPIEFCILTLTYDPATDTTIYTGSCDVSICATQMAGSNDTYKFVCSNTAYDNTDASVLGPPPASASSPPVGAIVGGTIGGVAAVGAIGGAAWLAVRKFNKHQVKAL